MKFNLSYCLKDATGKITGEGEANCDLNQDALSILPKFGEVLYFSLRDVLKASQTNYKITLDLSSRETLIISNLGYHFEDFLHQLLKARNIQVLEDELIKEKPKKSFSDLEFSYVDKKNAFKGEGELKIYTDKLVVIPKNQEPIKIFLNTVKNIDDQDFSLTITLNDETTLKLLKLGEQYDYLVKLFSEIMNKLSLNIQQTLQELLPTVDPLSIRKVSRLLKEGRAAQKSAIAKISPQIWQELEKKLAQLEIKPEYDFLTNLAKTNKEAVSIGLKKEGGTELIWFLIPIGKVIALESTTNEGSGKATYFFKLTENIDQVLIEINDAMVQTNFKREPIYLSDEKLAGTEYQFALQKIPVLKKLRALFIGRVIHNSPEQWQKDVLKIIN